MRDDKREKTRKTRYSPKRRSDQTPRAALFSHREIAIWGLRCANPVSAHRLHHAGPLRDTVPERTSKDQQGTSQRRTRRAARGADDRRNDYDYLFALHTTGQRVAELPRRRRRSRNRGIDKSKVEDNKKTTRRQRQRRHEDKKTTAERKGHKDEHPPSLCDHSVADCPPPWRRDGQNSREAKSVSASVSKHHDFLLREA